MLFLLSLCCFPGWNCYHRNSGPIWGVSQICIYQGELGVRSEFISVSCTFTPVVQSCERVFVIVIMQQNSTFGEELALLLCDFSLSHWTGYQWTSPSCWWRTSSPRLPGLFCWPHPHCSWQPWSATRHNFSHSYKKVTRGKTCRVKPAAKATACDFSSVFI